MEQKHMTTHPIKGQRVQPNKDTKLKICKVATHEHLVCQNKKGTPLTIYTHVCEVPKGSGPENVHIPGIHIVQQSTMINYE